MSKIESLGIVRLEAMHYYVHDLSRSRRFYTEMFDLAEVGGSTSAFDASGKQHSAVFEANDVRLVVSEPKGEGGRAHRWLKRHPDGVGSLVFEVQDIDRTFRLLDGRGGTPISEVQSLTDDHGSFRTFSITTPFGGSTFRFVDRKNYRGLYPGVERLAQPTGGKNTFGFERIDHITTNFETMAPALLWMEHVMGFTRFWGIEFHTDDVHKEQKVAASHGSGLRSAVMWDPHSGAKFANNEPLRPFFKSSQINVFYEDQGGDGIQHAALTVPDILTSVQDMRQRGVDFMPTPSSYYQMLPSRLAQIGVKKIDEDIATLEKLQILVDGGEEHSYMLQIFLKDSAGLYKDQKAGPFFYEIIQRKGDKGFGGGNFRALFESIEREQKQERRA